MSPHQKRFKEKITIPDGLTWNYYSNHTQDTSSGIGTNILERSLWGDESFADEAPVPVEVLQAGDVSYKYRLSNTDFGELLLPSYTHDIIYIEPLSNMSIENKVSTQFTNTVIDAIKQYRPEIKNVHAIHCRAVFARDRQRIYNNDA